MVKVTEEFDNHKLVVEIKPFLDASSIDLGEIDFQVDVEHPDGSLYPAEFTAYYVAMPGTRYIWFERPAPQNSLDGRLQRHLAHVNDLRIVDKKLFDRGVAEYELHQQNNVQQG